MTLHSQRLPFSLDPLIAEAKRRARRRWIISVLIVATLAAGTALALALKPAGPPGGSRVTGGDSAQGKPFATVTSPRFRAAAGWHVGSQSARSCHIRQTHPCVRAFGWAATVPCPDCGTDEPLRTLSALPPDGAVIQLVTLRIGDTHPSRLSWPPRVSEADVQSGLAGPAKLSLAVAMNGGRTGTTDWSLLVWFGRMHPTTHQIARVNAELRRASR